LIDDVPIDKKNKPYNIFLCKIKDKKIKLPEKGTLLLMDYNGLRKIGEKNIGNYYFSFKKDIFKGVDGSVNVYITTKMEENPQKINPIKLDDKYKNNLFEKLAGLLKNNKALEEKMGTTYKEKISFKELQDSFNAPWVWSLHTEPITDKEELTKCLTNVNYY